MEFMMDKKNAFHDAMFEQKAQEMISLIIAICEEHINDARGHPSRAHSSLAASALAASALSLQKAIETFRAIERICE
jgi:hypothetical protein